MDIAAHYVKKIYVASNQSNTTYWYNIVMVDKDGNNEEITIYGDGKMPEVVFGEPE